MEQFLSDDSEATAPVLVPGMKGRGSCWRESVRKITDTRLRCDGTAWPRWKASGQCSTFDFKFEKECIMQQCSWQTEVTVGRSVRQLYGRITLDGNQRRQLWGSCQSHFVQLQDWSSCSSVLSKMRWISCKCNTHSLLTHNNTSNKMTREKTRLVSQPVIPV